MSSSDLKTQLAQRAQGQNGNGGHQEQGLTINRLMQTASVRQRFEQVLGSKAAGFMSSIINVVNSNPQLKLCDPHKVVACAAIAAALDLPIDPNLGFAYIIPYQQRGGTYQPQFQMGYRGYIQLAMRTGMYKTINATHVYEGEIESYNRITGEVVFSKDGPKSDKIVGYIAYFKLINGFEKYEYWPVEKVQAHAQRFSQSYRSGRSSPWQTDFNAMAIKTVLKSLLSRYGILSIDMQTAQLADQATPNEREDGSVDYEYPDGVTLDATDYTVGGDAPVQPTPEAPADNGGDQTGLDW